MKGSNFENGACGAAPGVFWVKCGPGAPSGAMSQKNINSGRRRCWWTGDGETSLERDFIKRGVSSEGRANDVREITWEVTLCGHSSVLANLVRLL